MATQAVARRPANQVAETDGHPLTVFRAQLEQRAEEFKMVLPSHITPEKFQRTVLTAVQADPDILGADRRSLITACMKAAQDGLLPDKREAALVVFTVNKKDAGGNWEKHKLVQYMPMVYGLRKKILQSGEIKDIHANVVYRQEIEAGLFIYEEGTERMLRHKPLLDPAFDPSDDDIALAYSVATFNDGLQSFEVMRRSEINKVRNVSQTGALVDKKGQPRTPSGPWVDWFSEQAKKTVIRRHSKSLPMSGDIIDVEAADALLSARSAVHLLESEVGGTPEAISPPRRGQDDGADGEPDQTGNPAYDPETGEVHRDEESGDDEDLTVAQDQADLIPPTLDEAKDALKACKSAGDVNTELGKLRQHFSGEDLDELNFYGAEVIDALIKKAAK